MKEKSQSLHLQTHELATKGNFYLNILGERNSFFSPGIPSTHWLLIQQLISQWKGTSTSFFHLFIFCRTCDDQHILSKILHFKNISNNLHGCFFLLLLYWFLHNHFFIILNFFFSILCTQCYNSNRGHCVHLHRNTLSSPS